LRKGAKDEMNAGITSNNIAYVTSDPLYAFVRSSTAARLRRSASIGLLQHPKLDALIDEAQRTFDPVKQDELMAPVHTLVVDDAVLVWVVHDTNPHAAVPKVTKFIQAQHWSRP